MSDNLFDRNKAKERIMIFLNREYLPNGKGGLFYIKDCDQDLRNIEIWVQLNWYLSAIVN